MPPAQRLLRAEKRGLGPGPGAGRRTGKDWGAPRFEAAHSRIRIRDGAAVRLEAALSIVLGLELR